MAIKDLMSHAVTVRRIADRRVLWSIMLGRLQAGELDVAAWLHKVFPRVPLPAELDDCAAGERLARLYADYLAVPIITAAPPLDPAASETISIDGQSWSIPQLFWREVLQPAMRAAGQKLPPDAFRK
ncbi:MAG: hypothetical protein AB7S36_08545 [Planctomycetota bacterium]